jgi:hypothetical protein
MYSVIVHCVAVQNTAPKWHLLFETGSTTNPKIPQDKTTLFWGSAQM